MFCLLQLLRLLMQVPRTDAGESATNCDQLSRALKDEEQRYWQVSRGTVPGDHLAEGRKLDELGWQLRECRVHEAEAKRAQEQREEQDRQINSRATAREKNV